MFPTIVDRMLGIAKNLVQRGGAKFSRKPLPSASGEVYRCCFNGDMVKYPLVSLEVTEYDVLVAPYNTPVAAAQHLKDNWTEPTIYIGNDPEPKSILISLGQWLPKRVFKCSEGNISPSLLTALIDSKESMPEILTDHTPEYKIIEQELNNFKLQAEDWYEKNYLS